MKWPSGNIWGQALARIAARLLTPDAPPIIRSISKSAKTSRLARNFHLDRFSEIWYLKCNPIL
ncbi:hypothetical protein BCO26_1293 [Heyndrickxia coagulans 2-6]|nr:hypothetical protein BCO26_1293 [Heyndrickxia coagulans 2-6]